MAAMQRLFIYGTLAPGQPNHHVMGAVAGTWARASVRGALSHSGWGADLGYPALDPDGAGTVDGWLFCSAALNAHWARLDAFEGADYRRVDVAATLASGEVLPAFVYAAV